MLRLWSQRRSVPMVRGLAVRCFAAAAQATNITPVSSLQFHPTRTYPTAVVSSTWGVPVEISLIAQLSHGAGTRLYEEATARQAQHARFVDELEEPSAKLGGTRLELQDKTALYTFSVGQGGHPFHRHQGHRVVVAVSGSGGADLRFSPATPDDIKARPAAFSEKLHVVRVPSDCIFTMRFDGRTWHQFVPTPCPTSSFTPINPAFFALSVHTDETGGALDARTRALVEKDEATIASLTELLPNECVNTIDVDRAALAAPITQLSLERWGELEDVCRFIRGTAGAVTGTIARAQSRRLTGAGFALSKAGRSHRTGAHYVVRELKHEGLPAWLQPAAAAMLPSSSHADAFAVRIPAFSIAQRLALQDALLGQGAATAGERALEALLDGFLENAPTGVGRLQRLRNIIVRPLGLRTSPLGCPVSSLLGNSKTLFANRFPVHSVIRPVEAKEPATTQQQQQGATTPSASRVAVVLGADDKHLRFRTLVGVDVSTQEVYMATRVEPLNWFGHMYYSLIDRAHRNFVSPELLRWASAFATAALEQQQGVLPQERLNHVQDAQAPLAPA